VGRDTLLFRRDEARRARRLAVQSKVRRDLREALEALVPGERVWIFGSLTRPGRFNDASDVDLALETEPALMSAGQLSSELSNRLARPVDVVLLETCRFRDKIRREGELWTL
jgi:predicted nucleotidyltransferase